METDIHNKDLALRLVLKERPRATRKWPTGLFSMEEPVKLTDDAKQRKQKSHEAINQKPKPHHELTK